MATRISQLIPTGMKLELRIKPTDSVELYDNDYLFEDLSDLVNPQFKAWYCQQFYRIGKDKVLILASQARSDARTSPQKLFSYLLKNAMSGIVKV